MHLMYLSCGVQSFQMIHDVYTFTETTIKLRFNITHLVEKSHGWQAAGISTKCHEPFAASNL